MKWEASSNYSKEDIQTMQQDAIQRVREMQRRADEALRSAQKSPSFFSTPHPAHFGQERQSLQETTQRSRQENPSAGAWQRAGPADKPEREERPPQETEPRQNHSHEEHQTGEQSRPESPQDQPKENPEDTPPNGQQDGNQGEQQIPGQQETGEEAQDWMPSFQPPQERDILGRLLSALHLDNERLMILLLLFVLYNDGADYTLLFALLYLLI